MANDVVQLAGDLEALVGDAAAGLLVAATLGLEGSNAAAADGIAEEDGDQHPGAVHRPVRVRARHRRLLEPDREYGGANERQRNGADARQRGIGDRGIHRYQDDELHGEERGVFAKVEEGEDRDAHQRQHRVDAADGQTGGAKPEQDVIEGVRPEIDVGDTTAITVDGWDRPVAAAGETAAEEAVALERTAVAGELRRSDQAERQREPGIEEQGRYARRLATEPVHS